MKRKLFVVIHTVCSKLNGLSHAIEQARISKENGADGIFLIPDYAKGNERKANSEDQLLYLSRLKEDFPGFSIGVNFLTGFSGIEDSIYDIQPDLIQTDGSSLSGLERERLPSTEFFCGVAFKYSRNEGLTGDRLREHCIRVCNTCDVPTTSGKATGISAEISKIREIISYFPNGKRLGIASGVTLENVDDYLTAGVTDFLVATSLVYHVDQLSRDILNPEMISCLANKIHSHK